MDDDYGARIRKALLDWHARNDPRTLSWAEVQRQCMAILRAPATRVAVLKWKDGQQEPTIKEFRALGQVLGADPRDLAFGPAVVAAPQSVEDAPTGIKKLPGGRRKLGSDSRGQKAG